jgi:arylsulfate sulfotransferase
MSIIKIKKSFLFFSLLAVALIVIALKKESFLNLVSPLRIKHIDFYHVPENRLRFKVEVKTSRNSDVFIKYWQENDKDTLFTEVSKNNSAHELFILNTLGDTHYNFQVIAYNSYRQTNSKIYPFAVKPIYEATPTFTLEETNPGISKELEGKYFLTQILSEPGSINIIDHLGNIVWYQVFTKGVKVSHWTQQRTIINIVGSESIPSSGGDEIIEIDLAGNIVTHFKYGKKGMDKLVHHEVRKDEEGNIYAITFDKRSIDLSSIGGAKQDSVQGDGIVVFNPSGEKIWEWSILDHIDILKYPNILNIKKDIVHANSVTKDKDGNFLISYRDLNQVWKIDYKTKKVLWKFGEGGDFIMNPDDLFSAQHYAHINNNGDLMILDNGVAHQVSRAMSFTLNEQNHTYQTKINIPLPKAYFTEKKGNAQIINNDKVLFCLTEPQSILITNKEGKFLWKVKIEGDPYRVEEISDFLNKKPI